MDTFWLRSTVFWISRQWPGWMLLELYHLGQNVIETLKVQCFFFFAKGDKYDLVALFDVDVVGFSLSITG